MTVIVTKNSSTASAVPTTSDLVQGELAVNVTDKRIFTENASTQIVELGTNPSTITTATATVTGTLTANGTFASSNAVLTGGSINSTPIGATTPSTIVGSTITANTGFVGGLTGNVTGNLTGNVTGNVTGDLTGDVTGNLTAGSGTTTLNNLVVNGTVDFNAAVLSDLGSPVVSTDAATKGYVDTAVSNVIDAAPAALDTLNELAAALGDDANFSSTVTTALATKLPLAGGTMTGAIAMGASKITGLGDPTAAQDAATKTYVDTADALKLNLTGGTMSGAIAMGTNKITGVGDPTLAQDAATKAYTDSILGSATSAADSAAAAATSASNAATSASDAATSATASATSATAAAASYDAFDDRYLGDKASDPTLDNDGNALLTGALYFNTTSDVMKVYDGSAWNIAAISSASPTFTGTVTADGLDINGTATMDGLTVDGNVSISSTLPLVRLTDTDNTNSQVDIDYNFGYFQIDVDANQVDAAEAFRIAIGGTKHFELSTGGDISFYEDTGTTPKFFWDASAERLGVGTSSPEKPLHVNSGTGNIGIRVESSDATSSIEFIDNGTTSTGTSARVGGISDDFFVQTNGIERMRINSSGNVGIGTTNPVNTGNYTTLDINGTTGSIVNLKDNDVRVGSFFNTVNDVSIGNFTATGFLGFRTNSTERMRIDASGNVGIGTSSPAGLLDIAGGPSATPLTVRGGTGDLASIDLIGGTGGNDNSSIRSKWSLHLDCNSTGAITNRSIIFGNGTTETARIDSSGNLLVGKTSDNNAVAGTTISNSGIVKATRTDWSLLLNRLTTDGDIALFQKDGATVGSIGSEGGDSLYIVNGDTGLRFVGGVDSIVPSNANGAVRDAAIDIGFSSQRFKDLYLSGTANVANVSETVYALSGTALDPANGGIQTKTLAANTTFTDSLSSGDAIVLQLEAGASYTVTWPTMQWVTSGGNVAPTLTAKDTLVFWKVSSTLYGAYTGSYV
jgi:cytoskeletal protein CcmA (bactofilin family)